MKTLIYTIIALPFVYFAMIGYAYISPSTEAHDYAMQRLETKCINEWNDIQIKDFLEELEQFLIELSEHYDSTKDSDLLNIRDEMLGEVNKLKYLLTLD